ncbi:MAG: M28 family peptidase [Bacteroidia bacterium]|nr:M28 family peptidase [Bacteroidia bacterium]
MIANRLLIAAAFCLMCTSCDDPKTPDSKGVVAEVAEPSKAIERPAFSADSAFVYIEKQLAFGPRVPNTGAHVQCARWLEAKLTGLGAKVVMQPANVKAWNGDQLSIVNIIASYNLEATRRVMVTAHWDSRPFADQDADPENHDDPVPAANDGASGVAVILEIARQLQLLPADIGVDLLLWDAEDYGSPGESDSYALGSQLWARQPHVPGYRAIFGINLDMVGAKYAQFPKEGYSMQYAPDVVQRVWDAARSLGHGNFFISRRNDPIVDDHYYVNKIAQIPMVDVIDIRQGTGFFDDWHTRGDDITNIDKPTLQAVGETVLAVVYQAR